MTLRCTMPSGKSQTEMATYCYVLEYYRNLFLIVLKAEKSKIKELVDSVPGEGLLPSS